MPRPLRRLPALLLALLAPAALAQVADDFADGDFSADPPWTGDTDRFTVVPFGADFALRSDGLAEPDTIALATASDVASGRWAFTFRHETNLSTANGTRVYLVADTPDLRGEVRGYYVQLGTNNTDQVRLYRQDGPASERALLGASEATPVAGDTNTVSVEVLRDAAGAWEVRVGGVPVIAGVEDATYTTSAALGVWLKHSTATGARFFWDDIVAEPGDDVDLSPPEPVGVAVLEGGARLLVTFDEALDPATVAPSAFTVEGVGQPLAAQAPDAERVLLTFDPAIPAGAHTLAVSGVADLAGNVQAGAEIAFTVEEGDEEPPVLVAAEAVSATEVEVAFDEVVIGCDASAYELDHDIGQPASLVCPTGPSPSRTLVLGQPLQPGLSYTVTARGVADEAGNVQPETSASFFFGTFDAPAPRDVVVNEILYDPPVTSSNEYVELYNRTADRTFDLSTFVLADEADSPVRLTATPTALGPGQYAVLARNADAFAEAFPGVPFVAVAGFPALNNTGDAAVLRHVTAAGDTVTVDSVRFSPGWGGTDASLERRSPDGPSNAAANWATTLDAAGGTPGAPNSVEPDTAPPQPVRAEITDDGLTVAVTFDEPLDPASVTPGAFSVEGVGTPDAATYDEGDAPTVVLTLAAPPPGPGTYAVTVTGVRDLLGNVTDGATVPFEYEPDVTPPALVAAAALDATTLEVTFSELVDPATAGDPARYAISDGVGQPSAVEVAPGGDARRVRLALAAPLSGPQAYTLTAAGIADLAGNVLTEGSITFFFGEGDAPEPGDLLVNEVMYDPPVTASNEWVEVLNVSERTFDLSAFTLSDESGGVRVSEQPRFVLPGEYAVLVRNADAFAAAFPGVPFVAVAGFPNLNNTGDAVVLRYAPSEGPAVTTDSVRFSPSWGGTDASLERRSPAGPSNSAGNWATTLAPAGGTPGAPNSLPPDTDPPGVEEVTVDNEGTTLTVFFDEFLDPASVTPGAFSIEGVGAPVEAAYSAEPDPAVVLTLATPLAPGAYTLTVSGVRDLLGNAAEDAAVAFTYDPDRTPPALVGASAPTPTTVEVVFSEPLDPATAADPAHYVISDGVGRPEAAAFAPGGDPTRVALTLGAPLEEGVLYTLTVTGVADRFGNVLPEVQTRLLLGGGDTPRPGDVVVNEVMYDLPSARNGEEYVELLNRSERTFDLSRFTLSDTGPPGPVARVPRLLLPGEHVAVVADAEAFTARFGDELPFVEAPSFPGLNNAGDAVVVRFEGAAIDSLVYDAAWQRPELDDATGIALERIDPDGPSASGQNWSSSLDPSGGTPGLRNSVFLPPGEAPAGPGVTADPSPFRADVGTQIRYTLTSEAALVRVRIFDAAGRLVRTLEEAALGGSAQTGTLTWRGLDDAGRPLRVGIYVVFLEALDLRGGRTEAYKAAVVLGRQL